MLAEYELHLQNVRQLKSRSVETAVAKVRHVFGDCHLAINRVTGACLAERVQARLLAGRAVTSVAGELNNAKTFLRWVSRRGLVDAKLVATLDEVRIEGRRRRGKVKLTVDERPSTESASSNYRK